jgi:DNA-binding CsgD family transcriptional regulator
MFEQLAYAIDSQARRPETSYKPALIRPCESNYDNDSFVWRFYKQQGVVVRITTTGEYDLVVNGDSTTAINETPITALNPRDMVQKIKAVIGLNNVQIADILRISRPSLYNHLSEKGAPESLEGYQNLYEIARQIEALGVDIKPGLKSILVEGDTLLSHLKRGADQEKIYQISSIIAKKLASASSTTSPSVEDQRRLSRELTRFS